MRKHTLIKRWIALFTIALGSIGLAGCFQGGGHHKGEAMFDMIAWKLDFNDAQQAKLEDIKAEMKRIRGEMKAQRENDKASLIALIENETFDTAAAAQLVTQKQMAITQYTPSVLEKIAALHATLSPEQKAKIIAKIEEGPRHGKRAN